MRVPAANILVVAKSGWSDLGDLARIRFLEANALQMHLFHAFHACLGDTA